MKRLLLIPLTILFFSCDRNPTATDDKIPLNWAIDGNTCYFTDTTNMCEGYNSLLYEAYQYESLEVINMGYSGSSDYIIEICNSVAPPIIYLEDGIACDQIGDDEFANYHEYGVCYEWHYDYIYSNTCYIPQRNFQFIQYK